MSGLDVLIVAVVATAAIAWLHRSQLGALQHFALAAFGLGAAEAVVLGVAGSCRVGQGVMIALAALLLIGAAVLWFRSRNHSTDPPGGGPALARWRCLATTVVVIGLGVALVSWWANSGPEVAGFVGIAAAVYGVGQLLAELRRQHQHSAWVGVPLTTVGASAIVVGLVAATPGAAKPALITAGIGIALCIVGWSLVSEDVIRLFGAQNRPLASRAVIPASVAGLVLAGTAAAELVVIGVSWRQAIAIVFVLAVLTGAVTANTSIDAFIIVFIAALAWSVAPTETGSPPNIEPSEGESVIVAFGDSFISGEGADRFYEGTNVRGDDSIHNECRRSPTAYVPRLLEQAPGGGDRLPSVGAKNVAFLGCSGAQAIDIYESSQYPNEPIGGDEALPQTEQLKRLMDRRSVQPALALVNIGGNDALFGEIGKACVLPGDCSEIGQKWLDNLATLGDKLAPAYAAIDEVIPAGVPILVVPYPIALNEDRCSWSQLSDDEHLFLNRFTQQLNDVIRVAATRAGFAFVDQVEDAFEEPRLRICDTNKDPEELGVNFIATNPTAGRLEERINPQRWFHNSLHPNHRGHERMRNVLTEWIETPGHLDPIGPQPDLPPARIRTLDQLMGTDDYAHCGNALRQPPDCHLETNQWSTKKAVGHLWRLAPPIVLALLGVWLMWVGGISEWRRRFG